MGSSWRSLEPGSREEKIYDAALAVARKKKIIP
jgi:hypothetical protein